MAKKATAPAVVEDDDLEELDEIEDEVAQAPAKKKATKAVKKAAAAPVKDEGPVYNANWLAELVNERHGTDYTAANIRVILRKMAKDGELDREVGTDRSRYSFTGAKDATVLAVLAHVKNGTLDAEKASRIEEAKAKKAVKKAAKPAPAEDDDEEIEEVAPAKQAKKAAPAKATRRR